MIPQDSFKLSLFYLKKSYKLLKTANKILELEDCDDCDTVNSRAYYSLYNAIQAVLSFDGVSFKSHGQCLGYFSGKYIKTGIISGDMQKIINLASELRNNSDYTPFYETGAEIAKQNIDNVSLFLETVKTFLKADYMAALADCCLAKLADIQKETDEDEYSGESARNAVIGFIGAEYPGLLSEEDVARVLAGIDFGYAPTN
jgi:uncharacterized protein (UPF0332 family)